MSEEKQCLICGTKQCDDWIERTNLAGKKAYFCGPEHYQEYKKKAEETGVCEFC